MYGPPALAPLGWILDGVEGKRFELRSNAHSCDETA